MVYLYILAAVLGSTILLYFSEECTIKISNKKINKALVLIAIIIPAIVAGARNIIEIGDTKLYAEILFKGAMNVSIIEYFKLFNKSYYAIEPLYLILTYIMANINKNYHIFLFVIAMINLYLIYAGLRKYKERFGIKIWFGMLAFYFIYYGKMFNIVRQCLAISILFYFSHYIFDNKKLKFFLGVVIACLIHITSILSVLLYVFYYLMKRRIFRKPIAIGVGIIGVYILFQYNSILSYFAPYLPSKFLTLYSIQTLDVAESSLFTNGFLVLYFGLQIINKKKENNIVEVNEWYFFALMLFTLFVGQLGGANANLSRISLYFGCMSLVEIANIKNVQQRILFVLYFAICFYMEFVYFGALPINTLG